MPLQETLKHSKAGLAQSLVGLLLLSPGAHKALFVPSQSLFSQTFLWKFCNQIPLAFKVKFPGGSQYLCWILRLGNLLWALELLQQHEKLLCYDCSPVCGLSAWLICGWSHGDLLQEDFCHLPHLPGLQSEPLSLRRVAADLGFHRRPSHTQRQVWLSLLCVCGGSLLLSLHSPAHRVLFAPSQRLWRV